VYPDDSDGEKKALGSDIVTTVSNEVEITDNCSGHCSLKDACLSVNLVQNGPTDDDPKIKCYPSQHSRIIEDVDSLLVSSDGPREDAIINEEFDRSVFSTGTHLPSGIMQYKRFQRAVDVLDSIETDLGNSIPSTTTNCEVDEMLQSLTDSITNEDFTSLQHIGTSGFVGATFCTTASSGTTNVIRTCVSSKDNHGSVSAVQPRSYVPSVLWVPVAYTSSGNNNDQFELGIEIIDATSPASNPIVGAVKDTSTIWSRLSTGDIILAINDNGTAGMTSGDVMTLMSLEANDSVLQTSATVVKLTIMSAWAASDGSETSSAPFDDTNTSPEISTSMDNDDHYQEDGN
jgi:hypothetical protein